MKWLRFNDTVMQVFTTRARNVRASVKLFELRVRTPGGVYFGAYGMPGYIFSAFSYAKPSIYGVILGLLEATKMYKLF